MSRIGIVYPRSNIDTVPSLIGATEALAEHGYDVDLFVITPGDQPLPHFGSPRVHVRSLGVEGRAEGSTTRLRGALKRVPWLPGAARAPLQRGYQALGASLAQGSRIVARARTAVIENAAEPFRCVIGVDPEGLALARSLARGAPLGYYSLELLLSYELTTTAEERLKAEELELSQDAAFVVVQDEARGRLLATDNHLPWERLVLVPNAPLGPARRQPSRYWHARFDLPPEARVVLHSGSLGDWTGIEEIVESAADWPEPWVLVVHTRYDAQSSAYVDGLRQRLDPRRVWLSLKPVARQDYDPLIDGADVGLAFYVPVLGSSFTQTNVQSIGLSSGKLAYYLRAGLPVIVNQAASIAAVVETSGCGVSVAGAAGIASALERIAAQHGVFSRAAGAFFDTHLDFRRAFDQVTRRIDAFASAT